MSAALVLGLGSLAAGAAPHASAQAGGKAAPGVPAATASDPVIVVGGDIACRPGGTVDATHCQQAATGDLLTSLNPSVVLPLGDSQYDSGTATEYAGSYDLVGWGRAKGISRPAAGNHEYQTTGAAGYYAYFGANAGDPAKGYYSYDVPGSNNSFRWHMIALNSECAVLGGGSSTAGCGAGSPQEQWLKADLAANPNVCTIAYWHKPRFSSSTTTPSSTTYTAFWNDLYNAGAEIVLNGHAHDYERFAPQTGSGAADPAKGVTEFVVGTGGAGHHTMGAAIANSVVRDASTFGVMKMTLHATAYDWQFIPIGGGFTDSGTGTCHNAGAPDTTPPSVPTGLTASAPTATQVNLNWSPSTDNVGVTNYKIYRGANGTTPGLLTTTSTNATIYTDTSVVGSTPYTYQVEAIDAAGNPSQRSSPAAVTTPPSGDTTPPTTPTNLTAEVVSWNEIDLAWTASTDSGTGVSGYKVYRQAAGQPGLTLLATTTGSGVGYQDLTVQPSSTYTYQVTAYDGANNESAPSNTVIASTPAGGTTRTFTFAPTADARISQANPTTNYGSSSLVADGSPVDDSLLRFDVATSDCASLTSATLTLTDNADGSVKGGDFYTTGSNWAESTVTWQSAPVRGTPLNSLGAVVSGGTYAVDVTNGVNTLNGPVAFRVGNTSSDGARYYPREATTASNRPKLTVVCAASGQPPDTQPPTVPGNLTANAVNGGEIDLSWITSTDNLGVTGYEIYRGGAKIGNVSGATLSYQDTTVSPATSYTYTVRAVDAAGNRSGDSNPASTTTPAARTYVFSSAADATIDATNSTTNYGSDTKLIADHSPIDDFLVRFDVVTTGCTAINNATLQLTDNADGSVHGGDFYTTDSNWAERTVTWDSAPARGTPLNSLGAVVSGGTYAVDVTNGVNTLNGPVAFRVGNTSSDGARYYPREAATASNRPQLKLTCS